MRLYRRKDALLAVIMLALGLVLLLNDGMVLGYTLFQSRIVLAQAGTYLKILGGLIAAFSAALLLRAFTPEKTEEEKTKRQGPDLLVVCGFASLFLYLLLLPRIGFIADTIGLLFLFTWMLRARETNLDLKDRSAVLRAAVFSASYSIALTLLMTFVFTKWLHVRLP